jgi:hypothetical protein
MLFKRVIRLDNNNSYLRIVRYNKNDKRQQWVFDAVTKTIRNNANRSWTLQPHSNGNGKHIQITGVNARWYQMFKYDGMFIRIERGKVFTVDGFVDKENAYVVMDEQKNDKETQHWDVILAENFPAPPGKGDFNQDFGLYIERPFYVVSELGTHRYLTHLPNGDFTIKTNINRPTQVWWFDQNTLTIKATDNKGYSWAILSNGGSEKMRW